MITRPHPQDVLIDDMSQSTQALRAWIDSVSDLLDRLEMREGAGSPNGVLKANKKTLYFNTAGAPGTYVYVNLDGLSSWAAIG